MHRNPHQIHLVENDPQRSYRPLENRCVRNVECIAVLLEGESALAGLLPALFRQVHIGPAREPVLPVPIAFSMPEQNEFLHEPINSLITEGLLSGKLSC